MLMVERLGHKVQEKWQRSQQSGQGRRTTPRDDAVGRKTCQRTVRLRVSTVELLKETGEQPLVRVAAGERQPDFAYGDAHQCAHLEQFEPDGLALPLAIAVPFRPNRRQASSNKYAIEERYSRSWFDRR